jgi:hypothetical protein
LFIFSAYPPAGRPPPGRYRQQCRASGGTKQHIPATDTHCKIPCLFGAIDETIEENGKASKNGSICPQVML